MITRKQCTCCKLSKPLAEFYSHPGNRRDGKQSRCKTCHTIASGDGNRRRTTAARQKWAAIAREAAGL